MASPNQRWLDGSESCCRLSKSFTQPTLERRLVTSKALKVNIKESVWCGMCKAV